MDLSSLVKPDTKPPMLTIVGTPGVGKTSLGALFPKTVMIRAEDGTSVFDSWKDEDKPMLFPVLPRAEAKDGKMVTSTKDVLMDQLRSLATQQHDFKTLLIDAVSSLHSLFEHEVKESYGVDNIAEAAGGYGKGYLVVKEMHGDVKAACDYLRDKKGMTIIFLAHSGVQKMKDRPDVDEYSVYSLAMDKNSVPVYVDLVDAVLYLRQDEFIKGRQEDKKGNTTKFGKIVQSGDRILVTSGNGKIGYVNAKSRWPMDSEIAVPVGENPLLDLIPFYQSKPKPKTKAAASTTTTEGEAQ